MYSTNAGIDNALKMREFYRSWGLPAYFTYEHPHTIKLAVVDRTYKFYDNGTYKIERPSWFQKFWQRLVSSF